MKYRHAIHPSRRELFSGLALLTMMAAVVMTRGTASSPRSASAEVIVDTFIPAAERPTDKKPVQNEAPENINRDDVSLESSSDR